MAAATGELALAGTVKRRVLCDELWRWEPCGFGLSAVGVVAGGEVVPWPAIEEARSWRAAGGLLLLSRPALASAVPAAAKAASAADADGHGRLTLPAVAHDAAGETGRRPLLSLA